MKTLVILFLTLNLAAQTYIGVELDPTMLIKEDGIDITFIVSDAQRILKQDFRVGAILEMYTKRHYYGVGVTLDYPVTYNYFFASIGIELGLIIRDKQTLEYNKEILIIEKSPTYGLNGTLGYWFADNFAITARLNYKRRYDLDKWNKDKYIPSGYLGIRYRLK